MTYQVINFKGTNIGSFNSNEVLQVEDIICFKDRLRVILDYDREYDTASGELTVYVYTKAVD